MTRTHVPEPPNLDRFSLALHGDRHEKAWWHVLSSAFPNYELFWRKYVVLLTNRIDARFRKDQQEWIRLRDNVPREFERMTMCHYSVFYFLARGTSLVYSTKYVHPEDAFAMLDSCGDNLEKYLDSLNAVAKLLGAQKNFLERLPKHECPALEEINAYRNVLLHNPVLGRAASSSAELLPRRDYLERVKDSWREARKLKPEELISSRVLLTRLQSEFAEYLQGKWGGILEVLDGRRQAFFDKIALSKHLPVADPLVEPTAYQPYGPSNQFGSTPPSGGFPALSSNTTPFGIGVDRRKDDDEWD